VYHAIEQAVKAWDSERRQVAKGSVELEAKPGKRVVSEAGSDGEQQ